MARRGVLTSEGFAVGAWRAAVELLEEAAEVEFVREAQTVGDLLYAQIACCEELDGCLVEAAVQVRFGGAAGGRGESSCEGVRCGPMGFGQVSDPQIGPQLVLYGLKNDTELGMRFEVLIDDGIQGGNAGGEPVFNLAA